MKCDRRWWNDGRLDREIAEAVADAWVVDVWPGIADEGDDYTARIFVQRRTDELCLRSPMSRREVDEADREIKAGLEECWRRLMEAAFA